MMIFTGFPKSVVDNISQFWPKWPKMAKILKFLHFKSLSVDATVPSYRDAPRNVRILIFWPNLVMMSKIGKFYRLLT